MSIGTLVGTRKHHGPSRSVFRLKVFVMSFCNGPFVDGELSWNTTNPNLTQCFRDTVLVGAPAAVLWIFGPISAFLNCRERRGNVLEIHHPRRNTRLSDLKVNYHFINEIFAHDFLCVDLGHPSAVGQFLYFDVFLKIFLPNM